MSPITQVQSPDRLKRAHAELLRTLIHNEPPSLNCRKAPIGAGDYVALQDYVRRVEASLILWADAVGAMASENAFEVNPDDLVNGIADPFDLFLSQLESAERAYRAGEYTNAAAE